MKRKQVKGGKSEFLGFNIMLCSKINSGYIKGLKLFVSLVLKTHSVIKC